MKRRILPILLLITPYLYLILYYLSLSDVNNVVNKLLFFSLLWVLLFIIFLISNIIFVVLSVSHDGKSEFFLFWNMLLKLTNIPVYLLVFFIGLFCAFLPGAVIYTPFLCAFDYMLLILTSIYGIGGLVHARRENKITTTTALILGFLHFVFCADVICAIVAFCKVKSINKKSNIQL